MDVDEVLINLKVLEQLQVNQKLISRGQYLNIEFTSVVPEFIRRWKRQDNRNETIKKLNIIINSALKIKNKNNAVEEYLQRSINGLKALKETYATCSQTTARIDVLINKISTNVNNTGASNTGASNTGASNDKSLKNKDYGLLENINLED